jgi:hypothetical protein
LAIDTIGTPTFCCVRVGAHKIKNLQMIAIAVEHQIGKLVPRNGVGENGEQS